MRLFLSVIRALELLKSAGFSSKLRKFNVIFRDTPMLIRVGRMIQNSPKRTLVSPANTFHKILLRDWYHFSRPKCLNGDPLQNIKVGIQKYLRSVYITYMSIKAIEGLESFFELSLSESTQSCGWNAFYGVKISHSVAKIFTFKVTALLTLYRKMRVQNPPIALCMAQLDVICYHISDNCCETSFF